MKLVTVSILVFLLVGIGVMAYLLSQSPPTMIFPFLALIAIFILVLLRPLRQHFLPNATFVPSVSLLKLLIGSGLVMFILLIVSVIILLHGTQNNPL
jgi:hypothetical protein